MNVCCDQSCRLSRRCNKPESPFLSCPVTCFDGKDDIPHDLQGQSSDYYSLAPPITDWAYGGFWMLWMIMSTSLH